MSLPRRIIEGKTYMVTRRCTQRTFLLRPGELVNQLFLFCMAHAASKYSISIHGFVVMSNHFHLVLTDKHAQLPKFMEWLNRTLAKALNAKYGRWENFWAPGSYSMQELCSYKDVLYKLEYMALNPVTSGLVGEATSWPGVTSINMAFGEKIKVQRPDLYFRDNSDIPKEVSLRLVKPPKLKNMSCKKLTEELLARVEERAREKVKEIKAGGGKILGRRKVLQMRIYRRGRKREKRRDISPRISAKNKNERIKALSELYEFHRSYRKALKQWLDGKRNVVFPAGTYKMRVFFGAMCESDEPGAPPGGWV